MNTKTFILLSLSVLTVGLSTGLQGAVQHSDVGSNPTINHIDPSPFKQIDPSPFRQTDPDPFRQADPDPFKQVAPDPFHNATPDPFRGGAQQTTGE